MSKFFAEADPNLNLRVLEISGKFFSRNKQFRESTLKAESVKQMIVSLTDESTINKIYKLPNLKEKQLRTVLYQKLQKDMEFITSLSTSSWIFSKAKMGNELLILVSLIDQLKVQTFKNSYALTLTPQVIFNALNGKIKKTFMLVHIFNNSSIIFVFHNGYLDYIQSIAVASNLNDAIELAKEYYKERKKIDISEFYFSGDAESLRNSPLKFKPVNKILKNVPKIKFLIPELLSTTKVPFLFSKKREIKTEAAISVLTAMFFISGLGFQINGLSLSKKLKETENQITNVEEEIDKLQIRQKYLQNKINELESVLNRKDVKQLLTTRKPEIVNFLSVLKPILKKSHSYIISLRKGPEKDYYEMTLITFCKDIKSPIEFNLFVSEFRKVRVSQSVKLINTFKYPVLQAIMSDWTFKIEEKSYVKSL